MKRGSLLFGLCTLMWCSLGLAGHSLGAEEGSVRALSNFAGQVNLFKVEGDKAFAVGVWGGILFFDREGGKLEASAISCPGTLEVNLATGSDTGTGRCIITDRDGDKAYAKWTCSGNARGCKGPFRFVGGTGKFSGISGESQFTVRVGAKMFTAITSSDSLEYFSTGLIIWPQLHYRIP